MAPFAVPGKKTQPKLNEKVNVINLDSFDDGAQKSQKTNGLSNSTIQEQVTSFVTSVSRESSRSRSKSHKSHSRQVASQLN